MMIPSRKEIKDYSSSCEHLLYAAASPHSIPFTQDEIEWIAYYTAEMTYLVDKLVRISRRQILHDRETLQEFAVASEALFLTDGLTDDEKESIRHSLSDVRTQVLDEQKDPALDR